MQRTPRIEIKYCTQCRWLLRAAWMAQELLTTFSTEIGEIALIPGSGGVFAVRIGDDAVWSRSAKGRFPEIKEFKQIVRNRIAPGWEQFSSNPHSSFPYSFLARAKT